MHIRYGLNFFSFLIWLGMVFDHKNHELKLKKLEKREKFLSDLPEEKNISSQYIKSKDLTWCSWNIDTVEQFSL